MSLSYSQNKETASRLTSLTASQRAQIELNRQKALLIRQAKLNQQKLNEVKSEKHTKKVVTVNNSKLIDTGAGFYIEESKDSNMHPYDSVKILTEFGALFAEDQPLCEDCLKPFNTSFLWTKFGLCVCDECRDDDKHSFITRTDAKENYVLKDGDLDRREPHLRFIVRKNPHNPRWGEMKLYLKLQIEKRALEVWGSEEALEEALQNKIRKGEVMKQKKYMNKMKELRMNVRSSLYTKTKKSHEHEYGEEVYYDDDDEYSKTCKTCNHTYRYDKM